MVKSFATALVSGITLLSAAALAADPPQDVSAKRHANLAHAQKAIETAYDALDAAQKANNDDMQGHAAKAKELLQQADAEVKAAAQAANVADSKKRKEGGK